MWSLGFHQARHVKPLLVDIFLAPGFEEVKSCIMSIPHRSTWKHCPFSYSWGSQRISWKSSWRSCRGSLCRSQLGHALEAHQYISCLPLTNTRTSCHLPSRTQRSLPDRSSILVLLICHYCTWSTFPWTWTNHQHLRCLGPTLRVYLQSP